VDPFPRLIAHHPSGIALALELAAVLVLVVVLGLVWSSGRRRELDRKRRYARMRDGTD
jgi:hypothetical protein